LLTSFVSAGQRPFISAPTISFVHTVCKSGIDEESGIDEDVFVIDAHASLAPGRTGHADTHATVMSASRRLLLLWLLF
jgi:hypothetical protein